MVGQRDEILPGDFAVPPMEDPVNLLQALIEADPANPADVEAFRLRACQWCYSTVTEDKDVRLQGCAQLRCGLRSLDAFRQERRWVLINARRLDDPQQVDERADLLRYVNRHIWQAGALTLGLALTEIGAYTLTTEGRSLRACLHGAVVAYLAGRSGEVVWNAGSGDAVAGRQALSQGFQRRRQRQQEEQEARVLLLHARGYNVFQIAKLMGWGGDRTRVNKILQEHGLKEKGRRHEQK